jgi:superfamily II DNA or RNA helicase
MSKIANFAPFSNTKGTVQDNGAEIIVTSPHTAAIKKYLTAENQSASYQIQRLEKQRTWTEEAEMQRLAELEKFRADLKREYFAELPDGSLSIPIGFWSICSDIDGIYNTEISKSDLPEWLRDYQKEDISHLLKYKRALLCLATGLGKCHGRGTQILMFDGTIKKVEEIVDGDIVMGDDSTPRNVTGVTQGKGNIYKIVPNKGEAFTCNDEHILCLMHTRTNKVKEIPLKEYLIQNKNFKHLHKLYRLPVTFSQKYIKYDPYWVGLWIGDGSTRDTSITTDEKDQEIIEYYVKFCNHYGLRLSKQPQKERTTNWNFVTPSGKPNPLRQFVLQNLRKNEIKTIPPDYLTSSYADRLRLLAGIIDSDGYYFDQTFEIAVKNDDLAEQIAFLARSLGFGCTKRKRTKTIKSIGFTGVYNILIICGDLFLVPTLLPRKQAPRNNPNKDPLKSGFKIEELGVDDYFGFCVDKNHRYLLHDCTVTHNTCVAIAITIQAIKAKKRVCMIVPTIDLVKQTLDSAKDFGITEISGAGGKYMYKPGCDLLVTTVQSASKYIDGFDVIVVDECHHSAANTWFNLLAGAVNATHVYGLSATPYRTDGLDLGIHAWIGPIVVDRNAKWGIANGWLAEPKIFMINVSGLPHFPSTKNAALAYGKLASHSKVQQHLLENIQKALSAGRTVMVIFNTVKAGQAFKKYCAGRLDFDVAHAGYRVPFLKFKKGETDLLVGNVKLFGEGVDVPRVSCIITLCNNKSEITTRQVLGRAMRISKGKKDAIVLDVGFDSYEPYVSAYKKRSKIYKTIVDVVKEKQI